MKIKRLRIIFLCSVLLLTAAAGLMYFLGCRLVPNDMCFFVDPGLQKFNESEARTLKPAILALKRPKTVILGGSRALDMLSPDVHARHSPGYNFSFAAVTPYELKAYTKYAVDVARPEEIIISLPYIIFMLEDERRQGFHLEEKSIGGVPNPDFYFSLMEALFQIVRVDRGKPNLINNSHKLFGSGGSAIISKQLAGCKFNSTEWHRNNLASYVKYYDSFNRDERKNEIYRQNIDHLSETLRYIAEHAADAEVKLVVLPVHDAVAAVRSFTGLTEHYLEWLKDVMSLAEDVGITSLLVFDNLQGLTDEEFAYRPDCDGDDLVKWYNPSHAFPTIGHQIEINDIPGSRFRWSGRNLMNEGELIEYERVTRRRYGEMARTCSDVEDILNNCFISANTGNR